MVATARLPLEDPPLSTTEIVQNQLDIREITRHERNLRAAPVTARAVRC